MAEPENALSLNGLHSFGEVFPVIVDRTPAEAAQWSRFARSWESGDVYRYRGQVFAAKDGAVRFGEKMWDFTTVKLDGKTVFESRVYETADCSEAIPVKAGWHEIEIVFENEKGRAGAAWPDYVDKGVPTGPGFGLAKDASKASTDPADYTFPADIGDGSVFRVPVEGAPIRVTGVRENQGVEVDIEYDELPAEAEITGIFQVGGDKLFSPSAVETPVGTIPAGKIGNQTISFANKLKVNSFRLRATLPGANLVWWSDVLRP